ncbi:MAG: hypothetical protein LUF92_05060 [Clostridiales bacterium]|nr:hypothetical protein [Clostridiales bacterium]
MMTIEKATDKPIKVVTSENQSKYISENDAEMDARAKEAVRVAIAKAKFCKKPVAKYDITSHKAYIEYPDGSRRYAE